jgi:hypothetical protein
MKKETQLRNARRVRFGAVALGVATAAVFAAFSALSGASLAAPTAAPVNTQEPSITGTARVGNVLQGARGTWTGAPTFAYRWVRCDASGGAPNGSDCAPIADATGTNYEVRSADRGFRLRFRVTATNADGSTTAASNPTARVTGSANGRPVNTERPSISGTPTPGNRLQANRGSWDGDEPMTFGFRWLRCDAQGNGCNDIGGATNNEYVVQDADVGRTLRVRVTARNDAGTTSATSAQTVVVQQQPPPTPPGQSVPASSVPKGERLIVSDVRFSPNPVRSRVDPITVQVRVKDTRGLIIREALVFMRSTPRVTSGDRRATGTDGWVTFQLVPNANFPQPRNGFNVQFFVKAYRAGDPPLAGIAGYRLVQVRLARPNA